MTPTPTPDAIMQLGTGYWGSKTLLSAVELGLFTELAAEGELDTDDLRARLAIHPRGARDFFDALVALGMLDRRDGRYRNTPAGETFLDRAKSSYVGGLLEMNSMRSYPVWASLTDALRTGEPQSGAKDAADAFAALYSNPQTLRGFVKAMSGVSAGAAQALAHALSWDRYRTVVDIGCAEGAVPVQLALAHRHLAGVGFDLPPVQPLFDEHVATAGLGDRLSFHTGDFFADELPSADVMVMGHILQDWDADQKRTLLQKAHAALRDEGVLVVYEPMIDDDRRRNAFALLMSLNMLVETPGGFDWTAAQHEKGLREAGFHEVSVQHLDGPISMAIGTKFQPRLKDGNGEMTTATFRYFVTDMDAAVEFYCRHLGFTEELRPSPFAAILGRGDLRLLLNVPDGPGAGAHAGTRSRAPTVRPRPWWRPSASRSPRACARARGEPPPNAAS